MPTSFASSYMSQHIQDHEPCNLFGEAYKFKNTYNFPDACLWGVHNMNVWGHDHFRTSTKRAHHSALPSLVQSAGPEIFHVGDSARGRVSLIYLGTYMNTYLFTYVVHTYIKMLHTDHTKIQIMKVKHTDHTGHTYMSFIPTYMYIHHA
jgi:hypothetical protein